MMEIKPETFEEKYKTLLNFLDAVQEGISAVDENGVLVFVNKACCDMLGISKEEVLHKRADSISKGKPLLMEVLEKRYAIVDREYFMEFKNKSLHLTSSAYPLLDPMGNIHGAIDIFRSIKRSRKLANHMAGKEAVFKFENICGSSKVMQDVIAKARKMAVSNETILVEGQSGCGKELFAQSIHNFSTRKDEAFIAVNCANLPSELVESELFGYEEGAFTGAQKGGRPGKFELANGGTLFLDEISEMPLHIQAKLLRAVEYKCINRIGGNRTFNLDVRIIAATNRNLEEMVKEGKFRGDLFYRLKVFYMRIPALRERENDIMELSLYFIKKFSTSMKKDIVSITDEATTLLTGYQWPGNVRELENCMARTVFLCEDGEIKREHILEAGIPEFNGKVQDDNTSRRLYGLTMERVKEVYEQQHGNKKKCAELLDISRPTLYKLLKLYKIN